MPSQQTKIQIWNMTLDLLKEQPLSATTDQTAAALWLSRNYDHQRDYLLERYLWKFALSRAAVPADATAPAWGWTKRYLIPTQALRFIPPTYDGSWNGKPMPYEEESGYILTNHEGPLLLRTINRVTNEGLFANGFVEALAVRLAMRCSHWMTGKISMFNTLSQLYTTTLSEVKDAMASQVAGGAYYDDDILDERSSYS
jgi:hypothetical protein